MARTLKDMFLEKQSRNEPPSKYSIGSANPLDGFKMSFGSNPDPIDRAKIATESPPFTYYADGLPTPLGVPIGQIILNARKSDNTDGKVLNFVEQALKNSTAAPSENDIDPRLARLGNVAATGLSVLGHRGKTPLKLGDSMTLAKYKTLSYPEIMIAGLFGGKKYESGAPKKGFIDTAMDGNMSAALGNLKSAIIGGDYLKGPSNYDHLDIKDLDSMYQRKWSLKRRSFLSMGVASTTFKFKNPIERGDSLNLLPPIKIKEKKGYVKKILEAGKQKNSLFSSVSNAAKDLLPLVFKDLRTEKIYFFRSLISSLNDSFSASWNAVNYLGNPNTYYAYGGLTRNLSLSFRLHAFSKIELEFIWKKCQDLAEMIAPALLQNESSTFYLGLVGPMIEITIGDYLVEQPCVINSLNYAIEEAIPWEIDAEESGISKVPHGVIVSLDISYVGKDVFTNEYRYFDTKMLKDVKNYDDDGFGDGGNSSRGIDKKKTIFSRNSFDQMRNKLKSLEKKVDEKITQISKSFDDLVGSKQTRDYDLEKAYESLNLSNKESDSPDYRKEEYDRELSILKKHLKLK